MPLLLHSLQKVQVLNETIILSVMEGKISSCRLEKFPPPFSFNLGWQPNTANKLDTEINQRKCKKPSLYYYHNTPYIIRHLIE